MDNKIPGDRSVPNSSVSNTWALAGRYIMLYALWLIMCGLGIWLVFRIRTNLVESVFFKIDPWQLRALDRYVLYGLGAIWIVGIFLLEGLLRNAMQKGRLVPFAGRLLLIGLALIGVSYLITFVV